MTRFTVFFSLSLIYCILSYDNKDFLRSKIIYGDIMKNNEIRVNLNKVDLRKLLSFYGKVNQVASYGQ